MAKQPVAKSNDMSEHTKTYEGFLSVTKFVVVTSFIVMVGLYCFIVALQPWLGWFFVIIAAPVALLVQRMQSSSGH